MSFEIMVNQLIRSIVLVQHPRTTPATCVSVDYTVRALIALYKYNKHITKIGSISISF